MDRSIVVVSRQFRNLEIHHRVVHNEGEIRIEMELREFLEHLAREMGFTIARNAAAMEAKLKAAMPAVIDAMKASTRFSPPPYRPGD